MAFEEFLLGKRQRLSWIAETSHGAGGTMANGEIVGLDARIEPDFNQNWQEILAAGADDRLVQSRVAGPLDLPFTITFTPVNWLFLKYCGYSISEGGGGGPNYVHTFSLANVIASFKLEWALRHTTDVVIKTSSAGAFIAGRVHEEGLRFAKGNVSASVSTEVNVLQVRNKGTYKTKKNRVRVKFDLLTLSSDGTKVATFNIFKNATVTGASFSDIDDHSVMEFSVTDGTVAGGVLEFPVQLSKTDSELVPLGDKDLILSPGESLAISAQTAAAGSTDVGTGLSWKELV